MFCTKLVKRNTYNSIVRPCLPATVDCYLNKLTKMLNHSCRYNCVHLEVVATVLSSMSISVLSMLGLVLWILAKKLARFYLLNVYLVYGSYGCWNRKQWQLKVWIYENFNSFRFVVNVMKLVPAKPDFII